MLNVLNAFCDFLIITSSLVIMIVCACVGTRMKKDTCDLIRLAYMVIFAAAVGAIVSLYFRTPTIIETLSLTGLAGLFLFDRRNDYGSDIRNGLQDMPMVKKDI